MVQMLNYNRWIKLLIMLSYTVLLVVLKTEYDYECTEFLGDGKNGILSNICMYNFPPCIISIDSC